MQPAPPRARPAFGASQAAAPPATQSRAGCAPGCPAAPRLGPRHLSGYKGLSLERAVSGQTGGRRSQAARRGARGSPRRAALPGSRRRHFVPSTGSAPGKRGRGGRGGGGPEAGPCGRSGRRGRHTRSWAPPPGGLNPLRSGLRRRWGGGGGGWRGVGGGALAPKPGGPGGGEPPGLPPIQNSEAAGARESPKLLQVSRKSGKDASKLSCHAKRGLSGGAVPVPFVRALERSPGSAAAGRGPRSWPDSDAAPFPFSLS